MWKCLLWNGQLYIYILMLEVGIADREMVADICDPLSKNPPFSHIP